MWPCPQFCVRKLQKSPPDCEVSRLANCRSDFTLTLCILQTYITLVEELPPTVFALSRFWHIDKHWLTFSYMLEQNSPPERFYPHPHSDAQGLLNSTSNSPFQPVTGEL